MPLVKIEIIKGKTPEYKKTLMQTVHEALEHALKIPEWDRFQRLYELEEDYFEHNDSKTNQFVMIELTLFPGRTPDVKREVIKEITRLLGVRLNIQPSDIFITINEPPLENWGMGGEQLSSRKN